MLNHAAKGLIPLTFLGMSSCSQPEKDTPPNFVIVLFDDLGWDDLGVHGNQIIETPNLDAFASQSAQFSSFYANPVCAASRASLLTGRHFLRTGVSHVHGGKDFLSLNEVTIADVLKQNGYKTAMWGKWHSGDAEKYHPWQRGFDEALSLRLYKHKEAEGYMNGEFISSNRWADELIVDHAIDFMHRNRENQFFAFVSLLAPHTPLVAPEEIVLKYMAKGLSRNFATLYAMVDFSDQQLGRLFAALDESGLKDNTIVMVLSDNGPAVNRAEITDEDRAIRYVNSYRGHKGDIWENGVKSPLFIRWPGKIRPQTITDLTSITDIFPTLLDFAKIEYQSPLPLDGVSFRKAFNGEEKIRERLVFDYANKGWPPSLIPYNPDGNYNEYQPVEKDKMASDEQVISVRTPQYKLMQNPGIDGDFDTADSIFLFDMIADPLETHNLIFSKPDVARVLQKSLTNWYKSILEEPHSYAPPVLYLNPHETTEIKATWASALSGNLLNTVTAVKRWQGQDAWVEYQIVAPQAGEYELTIHCTKSLQSMPECTVIVNDRKAISNIVHSHETVLGRIPLNKGLNRVRLTFEKDGNENNIDELLWIHFSQ